MILAIYRAVSRFILAVREEWRETGEIAESCRRLNR